jgi:endonuclease/exonuclease/phosphatase family metal-dependent hydrolase
MLPSRGRVLLFLLLAAFVVGIGGWFAQPTGTAAGGPVSLAGLTPATGKSTFRVAIFNIHSGIGTDDVLNLGRTADAVRDTDFCALNEVRGRMFGRDADQAHDLAAATGRAGVFLPTERRFWHDQFGNAFLTRLPVEHWSRIPLPADGSAGGYRNFTMLRLEVGGQNVNAVISHVNPLAIQPTQIQTLSAVFRSLQEPALLLADLNADFKQPDVKALIESPGVHDCLAETVGRKSGRVDWIFTRGLRTVAGGRVDNGASDHALFWVDLELPPPAAAGGDRSVGARLSSPRLAAPLAGRGALESCRTKDGARLASEAAKQEIVSSDRSDSHDGLKPSLHFQSDTGESSNMPIVLTEPELLP